MWKEKAWGLSNWCCWFWLEDCDGHCWTSYEQEVRKQVCPSDYVTRYPEAVVLKSIDVEHVAEELIPLFTRVGVQREILTNLRVDCYHPQMEGLMERLSCDLGNGMHTQLKTGCHLFHHVHQRSSIKSIGHAFNHSPVDLITKVAQVSSTL